MANLSSLSLAARWAWMLASPLQEEASRRWFVHAATPRMSGVPALDASWKPPPDGDTLIEDFINGLLYGGMPPAGLPSLEEVADGLLAFGDRASSKLRTRLLALDPCEEDGGRVDQRAVVRCEEVRDWLVHLAATRPALASSRARMGRMTFEQASASSGEWHRGMRAARMRALDEGRRVERERLARVPDRPGDAAEALRLDDGWAWFWLLTPESKDREGLVMGHCIGGGAYDRVRALSLRDASGTSHATASLWDGGGVRQAKGPGNRTLEGREARALAELATWLEREGHGTGTPTPPASPRPADDMLVEDFISQLMAA